MPEKIMKIVLKTIGIVVMAYLTISSCTVATVFVLDQSLKDTKSSELFPN